MEVIYLNNKIEKFILNLDSTTRARTERMIDLLEKHKYELEMPYSKALGGGLFELRILGKRQVRAIYSFKDKKAYIVHIFFKKS